MLRVGRRGQVVMDSEGNCHHEGRFVNWLNEEVCSICDQVLRRNVPVQGMRIEVLGTKRLPKLISRG